MEKRDKASIYLGISTGMLLLVSLACSMLTGGQGSPPTESAPPAIEQQIEEIVAEIDPDDPSTYGAPERIVSLGQPVVPIMLELLAAPDLTTRYAAVYVLSRLATEADIPELVKGLDDPDMSNRTTIAATLLWLGDDSGLPILQDALQSDQMLAFSHPPELLADYAQRVLDESGPEAPAVFPDGTGYGLLAAPAKLPLHDVKVTLAECRINIEIKLQFIGEGASQELAEVWAKAIKEMWDGRVSSKCCLTSVTVLTKVKGEVDANYAQVKVVKMPHAGARHTSEMTLAGTVGADGEANDIEGEWDTNDSGAVAAHEVGHALGVDDEYDADGKPSGAAKGEADGKGVPGIMAQTWKDEEDQTPIPKPRHIDTILQSRGLVCPDKCQAACLATPTPTITATSTTAPTNTPTATTAPTNTPQPGPTPIPVSGRYDATFGIGQDGGQHGTVINMPGEQILWVDFAGEAVISSDIIISGKAPFVEVSGTFDPDSGAFLAQGSGRVAEFPNIAVTFEGIIVDSSLAGTYGMGLNGGLPGGQAIFYDVMGALIIEAPTPTSAPVSAEIRAAVNNFAADFNQAMATGDTAFLLDSLHPDVVEIYGRQACTTYLEGISDPTFQISVVGVSGPAAWDYARDGFSRPLEAIFTVDVDRSFQGQSDRIEMHLDVMPPGANWFSDCGDPLTSAAAIHFEAPAFCRAGPGTEYPEKWSFVAGTTAPVVGTYENGWWIVQVDAPNTRTECCWVGAGTFQGNAAGIPLLTILPPAGSCP
jgi:hypothetical protein